MNVSFESNVIDVPSGTWRLDSGVIIHAFNFKKAIISKRSPTS